MQLLRFPASVLVRVFVFLDAAALATMQRVSPLLCDVIAADERLWWSLFLSVDGSHDVDCVGCGAAPVPPDGFGTWRSAFLAQRRARRLLAVHSAEAELLRQRVLVERGRQQTLLLERLLQRAGRRPRRGVDEDDPDILKDLDPTE